MTNYVVQSGDTLGKIARQFFGDARQFSLIVAANHILDPDRLSVGQSLVIPDPPGAGSISTSTYTVLSAASIAHNEQRLASVHPVVAMRARAMVEQCAAAGVPILITQGFRSIDEQDQLYAKGRTEPPIGKAYIVTKAKGGQSWHNFGLAFDIGVLDSMGKVDWNDDHPGWARAAVIGKSLGLEWGGDWTGFKDLPHYQYTGPLTLPDARRLIAAGLQSVWNQVA